MKNPQRPTPRALSDGSIIQLHSMFLTIQGEGPYTGRAALFVRLAGCNLQCPLCDTEYTEGARAVPLDELLRTIPPLTGAVNLIVITGGEPFRQNITPLIYWLLQSGYEVQVETNGHLAPQMEDQWTTIRYNERFKVVVSPKTAHVAPALAEIAACYKYVVKAGEIDDEGFPLTALDHPIAKGRQLARPPVGMDVYIQPADEKDDLRNEANLAAAVDIVMRYTGGSIGTYRLGVQTHKIAGLA